MLLPYFSDWWRQRLNSGHRRPVDPLEEMVYALTDPIIVFPAGGWENDLPERLKNELPLRRLAHVKLGPVGTEDKGYGL